MNLCNRRCSPKFVNSAKARCALRSSWGFFFFFLANCTAALQSPEPPKQQLPGGCLACALDNQREGFCIAAGGPPWDPKRRFWPKSCWFLSRTSALSPGTSKHLHFVTGAARILPSPLTAGSLQKSFNTWRCFPNTGHRIRKDLKSRLLGGRKHNVYQDICFHVLFYQ